MLAYNYINVIARQFKCKIFSIIKCHPTDIVSPLFNVKLTLNTLRMTFLN